MVNKPIFSHYTILASRPQTPLTMAEANYKINLWVNLKITKHSISEILQWGAIKVGNVWGTIGWPWSHQIKEGPNSNKT